MAGVARSEDTLPDEAACGNWVKETGACRSTDAPMRWKAVNKCSRGYCTTGRQDKERDGRVVTGGCC